jgi:hypothetical protein
MNFNTKGHSVEEKDFVSKFLEPGIHIAKIKEIEFVSSQGGTPGIKIVLEGKPEDALNGAGKTCESTYWLSEKAWPYTKDKVVSMADKLGLRERLDNLDANDAQDYAQGLNGIFAGTAGRWKLKGKEIAGKEGKNNWWKAEIAAFKFLEPVSVTDEASTLVFDKDNKYDMEHLVVADVETSLGGGDLNDGEDPWA